MDYQEGDSQSNGSFYPGFGRGKTGCITCRIRRKKCDEIRDDQNRCQECVRLNIPCAGWGEKRPDWARDDESLRFFKESIKKQSLTRASTRTTRPEDVSQSSSGGGTANDTSEFDWALLDEIAIKARNYAGYGTPITRNSLTPEMFDFPGLGTQLLSIAQAIKLPAEYMGYVTQAAELSNWKASQDASGTLSYRELARRGRAIEQSLLGLRPAAAAELGAGPMAVPTVPSKSYPYAYTTSGHGISSSMGGTAYPGVTNISSHQQYISYPAATQSVIVMPQSSFAAAVAQTSPAQLIFIDACIHSLHCIVSGPNPRVPELATATRTIMARFSAIPPHQRTPALIFPLSVAGILADSAEIHLVQTRIGEINAPMEVTQLVMGLITSVQQNRWAHELGSANAGLNA